MDKRLRYRQTKRKKSRKDKKEREKRKKEKKKEKKRKKKKKRKSIAMRPYEAASLSRREQSLTTLFKGNPFKKSKLGRIDVLCKGTSR